MFYTVCLYIALVAFGIGLIYKIAMWFRYKVGDLSRQDNASGRFGSAILSVLSTIFSGGIITLIKVFFVDVIFQWRILKEDTLRWIMHMCIFVGFMALFFIHALDNNYSHPFFSEFYSTLNPFMFLRNFFGLMVMVGVALAIYRRVKLKEMRRTNSGIDRFAIVLLAIIMISGVFLEASKIVSYNRFQDMVHEYIDSDLNITDYEDDEELKALMGYWQDKFDVVFPVKIETNEETLELGASVSEENQCSACHSRPGSAFLSFSIAGIIKPFANGLTAAGAEHFFLYIHYLACFIGLAYLPFSKFFHIISTPVSLLVNGVIKEEETKPAAIATRRAIELDACMHCSTCSSRCSVGIVYEQLKNSSILPSEKLISLKALVSGKELSEEQLRSIAEGSHICTNCYRCTGVCPAGINLQDLWFSIREDLAQRGYGEPYVLARDSVTSEFTKRTENTLKPLKPNGRELRKGLELSAQAETFTNCFECQTCTNACPVVGNFDDPKAQLGLLPHQIMHSLGLGLRDQALSSRMIWDCVTCYMCQEQCPQGVQVADVLYELKNLGYQVVKEEPSMLKKAG